MTSVSLGSGDTSGSQGCNESKVGICRSDFESSAEETRRAIHRVNTSLERISSLKAREGSAIAEADRLRMQWSKLLRETDGVLTKELQDLRSAEREARSLAEELALIGLEAQKSMEELRIDAATSASKSAALRRVVLSLVTDRVLDDLSKKLAPDLQRAYSLFRRREIESRTRRDRPDDSALLVAFAARFTAQLRQYSSDSDKDLNAAMGLSELDLTGIDPDLMNSPARRSLLSRQAACQ